MFRSWVPSASLRADLCTVASRRSRAKGRQKPSFQAGFADLAKVRSALVFGTGWSGLVPAGELGCEVQQDASVGAWRSEQLTYHVCEGAP